MLVCPDLIANVEYRGYVVCGECQTGDAQSDKDGDMLATVILTVSRRLSRWESTVRAIEHAVCDQAYERRGHTDIGAEEKQWLPVVVVEIVVDGSHLDLASSCELWWSSISHAPGRPLSTRTRRLEQQAVAQHDQVNVIQQRRVVQTVAQAHCMC
jgi:hypothetical protein